MKSLNTLSLLVLVTSATVFAAKAPAKAPSKTAQGLYALQTTNIDGETVSLGQYTGKVALVVNTASQCGFTPQYQGLEAVYQKYKDKGLVVLGFPSNDFGSQEPGSNSDIKTFCEKNYRITFPLFGKDKVTGAEKQPVYKFLTAATDGKSEEVSWNFEKFLINKDGKVVGRFKSSTAPTDEKLQKQIESLLGMTEVKTPKKS
jgi:glutathione peroxidase